jgi:hypothetical protein
MVTTCESYFRSFAFVLSVLVTPLGSADALAAEQSTGRNELNGCWKLPPPKSSTLLTFCFTRIKRYLAFILKQAPAWLATSKQPGDFAIHRPLSLKPGNFAHHLPWSLMMSAVLSNRPLTGGISHYRIADTEANGIVSVWSTVNASGIAGKRTHRRQ